MNNKSLVKLSNIIGIVSIILLVYWVFIFISITVFGLRVFRENMTETFYMSVLGILALMFGALMINMMFNLTRIAEKHNQDEVNLSERTSKKMVILFTLSFPILFAFLFGGDYMTSKKKEKTLIASAKSIIENDMEKSNKLVNYSFEKAWIAETADILDFYSEIDSHFPHVSVIVADTLGSSEIFLGFGEYYGNINDTIPPKKKNFIQSTTKEEREYLTQIFTEHKDQVRFSARKGNYELFYPYIKDGKIIVLYFSDYQKYGKVGS